MERRTGARLPVRSPSPELGAAQQGTSKSAGGPAMPSAHGQAASAQARGSQAGTGTQQSSKQQRPNAEPQLQQQTNGPQPPVPSENLPGVLSRQLSQDMEGFNVPEAGDAGLDTPDAMYAGRELYRALRGNQGDDPLVDDMLWDGDFLTTQREFIQKQQEEQMLERLERRMGSVRAAPATVTTDSGSSLGASAPSLAAVANAMKTGAKFMGLVGKAKPKATSGTGGWPISAAGAAMSTDGAATAVAIRSEPIKELEAEHLPTSVTKIVPMDAAASPRAAEGPGAHAALADGQASVATGSPVTPRLLNMLVSSLTGSPPAGKIGVLVAEDDGKQAGTGTAGGKAAAAQAPVDGVVEVAALAARKAAAASAEAHASDDKVNGENDLQRLDTTAKLEIAAQKEQNWFRRTAIQICTHSDFELLVLILIFGNCISLASYDPILHDSTRNKILEKVDIGLNAAFTVEMILRILSLGGVFAYLSHPWNAFDCVMVLAGYTTFIPMTGASGGGLEGLKALRALRAMRPLRTITRFPALRSIVVCFLEAVPLLVSVAAMLFFFLFIFAVAGTELFGDSFHWGCIDPVTGNTEANASAVGDEFGCGYRDCPAAFPVCNQFAKSESTQIAGFDNVGLSMLSVFQAMTLSNWSFSMYRTMDFLSPALVVYWFLLIIFGAYFVLNLFLAVLKSKFAKAKSLLDEKHRHRRAMKGANSKKQNILQRSSGWLKNRVQSYASSRAGSDAISTHISAVMSKRAASVTQDDVGVFQEASGFIGTVTSEANVTAAAAGVAWGAGGQSMTASGVPSSHAGPHSLGGTHSSLEAAHTHVEAMHSHVAPGQGATTLHVPAGGTAAGKPVLEKRLTRTSSMGSATSGQSAYTGVTGITGVTGTSTFSTGSLSHDCLLAIEEFDETVQDKPWYQRWPMMLQYRVRVLVCNSWFNNILLLAIVLNTVTLAMVFEGMSPQLEEALHEANYAFTFLFTIEMVLKIIGLGLWRYFTDPWSLFDATVVAFSLLEVITELMARSSAGGGMTALRSMRSLRVLRSFRVLRVMRMFKYLESLKMIASVLMSSMASFASIVVLLVLFWMVFSIMGLHVFGGLALDVPWPNSDDLVNSLILNFNTLNLENFQTQMYSVIRATSYASSAFWLAWIILGKYILLTLFLAVTLDAFERKYENDMKKGVRSQSIASTVFSRIKKAGARIRSAATSTAGGNSSGNKSGMFGSLWGGSGGHSSKFSHPGVQSGVVHDAVASFHGSAANSMKDPDAATAVVHVSAGSYNQGRRSSAEGDRLVSVNGEHQQHTSASFHHLGERRVPDRRSTDGARRRSTEGVRFAQPGQGHKGPVGEEVTNSEAIGSGFSLSGNVGWGTGIRRRKHQTGLRPDSAGSSRRLSYDWGLSNDSSLDNGDDRPGSAGIASGNLQYLRSMQRRQFLSRRTTSSNSSTGSGSSSARFRIESAAAFAAAAAAMALQPTHALPEFIDTSSEEETDDRGVATTPAAAMREATGHLESGVKANSFAEAMHLADLLHSSSNTSSQKDRVSSTKSQNGRRRSHSKDSDHPFTWHEFLSTIKAIDYPVLVQEQQQASLAASLRASANAATLGPIAEGIESDSDAGTTEPTHRAAPPDSGFDTAFEGEGVASFSKGVGAAAAAAVAAMEGRAVSPRPPSGPKPATASRGRPQQQLLLDTIEQEIASLGLHPGQAEPSTPLLLVHGNSNAQTAAATAAATLAEAGGRGSPRGILHVSNIESHEEGDGTNEAWPGLKDHDSGSDSDGAADRGSGSMTLSNKSPSAVKESHMESGEVRYQGIRAVKPRRVTLYTESMRERQEGPQAHADTKHTYHPGGKPSGLRAVAAVRTSEFDDAADTTATESRMDGSTPIVTGFDESLLLNGSVASPEPSITAKAIKRRKAAAGVAFAAELTGLGAVGLPGGVDEPGSATTAITAAAPGAADAANGQAAVPTIAAESSAANLASGLDSRRVSRQLSMTGSETNYSDLHSGHSGHSSWRSGTHSGNWSQASRSRSRPYPELTGTSLYLFTEFNPFRVFLYNLVTAKSFDYCMFFVILLNCIAMAYEYPHMTKATMDGLVLYWADISFTIMFSLESLFKIIAFGFKPYCSFFQNQVDLTIVVTSLIMTFLDTLDLQIVKALRVLRAIKPLRALTRSAGMQLIFKSLTLSLAAMGNVSIVVLLFFMIFAILGVQLFHGKFYSCNDTSVPDVAACVGTFQVDGVDTPRQWTNQPYNFDNIGMAMVSLFVTATLNGYTEILSSAMAAPQDPGLQPQPMSNWAAFFYFVAFVLVVAYTLLNLYIGVVFYQFSRIRLQSQTGSAFLTDDQTEWVELSRLVFRLKPPEKSPVPVNAFRKWLYYLVQSKKFEFAIMAVIITNSALMATAFYGEPEDMRHAVEDLNFAFTCVYVVELMVKVGGLGFVNYWKNNWNKFDFVLVLSSVVDMAVALALGSQASFLKVQKIMRMLRLARVVKLMRSMKGLRSLFGTLITSLPAFWNVGALLALLFYMYAYVGMLLFGNIKRNGGLNEHSNFERFWTAALTLFKIATNDNWTDIMVACMIAPPDCDPSAGECGSWVLYPYFVSFVLLVSVIMLNLFTAVILESFEAQQEQDRWKLRPDHLDEFVDLWAEYDDGTGSIEPKDLEAMLLRLSPPLGLGQTASSTDVLRFVFDLDIPLLAGRVPFHRTAYELVKRCSGAEIPEGMLKDQIDRLVTRAFKNLKADEVLNFSVAVTVMRVQRKWRARMRAAKLKRKREFRTERGVAPAYADVLAARDVVLKNAVTRCQAGDLRWRPNAAYAQQWQRAEAVVAAEQVAAAAALAASGSYRGSGSSDDADDNRIWTSIAGLKSSADGWMHKVTGGIQKFALGKLFAGSATQSPREHVGATSGRSSLWGLASRASSKIVSSVTSRRESESISRAASGAASETASRGVSARPSAH